MENILNNKPNEKIQPEIMKPHKNAEKRKIVLDIQLQREGTPYSP